MTHIRIVLSFVRTYNKNVTVCVFLRTYIRIVKCFVRTYIRVVICFVRTHNRVVLCGPTLGFWA